MEKGTLSHETKVQFRPLAVYHIFHNTDTRTVRFVSVNGESSRVKPSKKSLETLKKNVGKNFLKNNLVKKMLKKKF